MPTIAKVGKVGASKPMKVRESFSRVVGVGCADIPDARGTDHGGFLGGGDVITVGISPAKAAARPDGRFGDRLGERLPSSDVPPAGG